MAEGTWCEAGRWTRIYAGPAFGFIVLGTPWKKYTLRYRAVTLYLPFVFTGNALIGARTPVWFGLPTVWVEVTVCPEQEAVLTAAMWDHARVGTNIPAQGANMSS